MSFGIVIQPHGPANVLLVAPAPVPQTRPIPVAQMIYASGDYGHALACHKAAQEWARETGAATRDGLHAFINPPHHPQSPASSPFAPFYLMDDASWSVTVDFYCGPDTLAWLKSLPIPPGAGLLVVTAHVVVEEGASL